MKYTLPNGIVLDDGDSMVGNLTQHMLFLELKNLRIFLATFPNGSQEYLIVEGQDPIFASQKAEDIWFHLDIIKFSM